MSACLPGGGPWGCWGCGWDCWACCCWKKADWAAASIACPAEAPEAPVVRAGMLATEVLWNIKQPQNTEVVVAQFKAGFFKSLPSWAHVVGRRVEGSSDLGGFDLCLTQSLDWDCFVRADAAVLNFEADDDDQDQEEEQEEFSAYSAIAGTADAHNFSLASIWTTRPRCMKFRVRWYSWSEIGDHQEDVLSRFSMIRRPFTHCNYKRIL